MITLRDGIKFHDGTPLDSAALVRNFEEYRKSALIGAALKDISTVTATGPLEVTVTTSRPWPEFPWLPLPRRPHAHRGARPARLDPTARAS